MFKDVRKKIAKGFIRIGCWIDPRTQEELLKEQQAEIKNLIEKTKNAFSFLRKPE